MDIKNLITPDAVVPDLRAGDKRRVLDALAERAAGMLGIDRRIVAQALMDREELGSTGMGEGAAIPHARLPTVLRPFGVFARLQAPVDFDAVDGRPVDLVCLLLLPAARSGGESLNALACVARRLRNPDLLDRMRRAADAKTIYVLLLEPAPAS